MNIVRPEIEKKIDLLLAEMSLEHKVGQLQQISITVDDLYDQVKAGRVGSAILTGTPTAGIDNTSDVESERLNQLQDYAKKNGSKIPIIFGRDVIHGYRTVFPIPLGLAATFNEETIYNGCRILAKEARAEGVHWTFAPMMDVSRDPRWGRMAESFGEDSLLASRMAASAVKGLQGDDLSKKDSIAACAKHFIGYSAAEGGRDYAITEISDNTLFNVFLRPFIAAVNAGAVTVMGAFSQIGGQPLSANRRLIREVLKDQVGFEGFMVSDWEAIYEMIAHGRVADEKEAALVGFNAGTDMEMISECYAKYLPELIENKQISEKLLDESVRRILRVKFALGLFDEQQTVLSREYSTKIQFCPAHREAATLCAAESFVLLENKNDALPLNDENEKILFCGPMFDAAEQMWGTWTLDAEENEAESIRNCLSKRYNGNDNILFDDGYTDHTLYHARRVDKVVIFLGEHPCRTGEMSSNTDISLPPCQLELVKKIKLLGKEVVSVVFCGRSLDVTELSQVSDALLIAWHPGSMGAEALFRVLSGEIVPSGRLPVSFPRSVGHIPAHYNQHSTGRPYTRDTSRYIDSLCDSLYPFGYGLTYTEFSYSNITISGDKLNSDSTLKASVDIENTGDIAGIETVQLYIRDKVASAVRPIKELVDFKRVELQAGEKKCVEFEITPQMLEFYSARDVWEVEEGEFLLTIGSDSLVTPDISFFYEN